MVEKDHLVYTTEGLVQLSKMEVKDVVEICDAGRIVATEYYLDGKMVRRSACLDLWKPMTLEGN